MKFSPLEVQIAVCIDSPTGHISHATQAPATNTRRGVGAATLGLLGALDEFAAAQWFAQSKIAIDKAKEQEWTVFPETVVSFTQHPAQHLRQ